MTDLMLTDQTMSAASDDADIEITSAAIRGYGRLLRTVGDRLLLHVRPDGGLICEDRTRRGRPVLWRIASDGTIVADRPYSYQLGAFAPGALPAATAA